MSATRMITYYEKEIYESDFAINQCCDYVQLMKKYLEGGTWTHLSKTKGKEEKKQIEKPPYQDPDEWPGCSYYWELTRFLNKRESWLEDKMKKMGKAYQPYRYVAPNKCKKPEEEKGKGQEQGSNKSEIIVKIVNGDGKGEEKIRLKSDQFGFSVGESRAKFNSHPYGYLCKLVEKEKKTKKEKDEVCEVIEKCIYHTRTLGGGFLWQVDPGDARNQKAVYGYYNMNRGTDSYIEDRVDLTLLEIKHLFEWLGMPKDKHKEDTLFSGDLLSSRVIKCKEEKGVREYIEWLLHFGTFENFIRFFCLDDFVDETWMPLDIMKSKLEWDDKKKGPKSSNVGKSSFPLKDPTEYKPNDSDSYKKLKKLSAADLKQMLENVRILTLARSYKMQEVIDGISN